MNAQVVLNGTVLNEEEVPISNVKVEEFGTKNVTFSNEKGVFTMHFSSPENVFLFTHDVYDSLRLTLDPRVVTNVFLSHSGNPFSLENYVGYTDFTTKNPNKNLEIMPYFLGEADVNRQLQMLPGIEHGREGFSNLFVRGGDVDQNLMLYNGTPIYNYNHLFGLSSVFHQKSIQNTEVYKGVSPAKFGGRTSSVISLESTKDALYSGIKGELEISPLNAGLYIESVKKGKSYFTLSARRSWIDMLFPIEERENSFNFNMYDLQGNYGIKLENGSSLDLSIMNTRDLYFIADTFDTDSLRNFKRFSYNQQWGNLLGSVKYTHSISSRLSASHSAHYTNYRSLTSAANETFNFVNGGVIPFSERKVTSGVRDFVIRSDWSYSYNNTNKLNLGLQSNTRLFLTGRFENISRDFAGLDDVDEVLGTANYSVSSENSIYAENEYRNSDDFKLNYGARATLFTYDGFTQAVIEPRLHATYYLNKNDALKFAYNRNNQFVSQLNVGESGNPSNIWIPATQLVLPQKSNIMEVGYEKRLGKMYSLIAGGFFKTFNNLSTVSNFDDVLNSSLDWQDAVLQGTGNAYGLELMVQKNEGTISGWFGYTFGKSTRNFPDLFEDDFLFTYDRTHMIKIYANYKSNDLWDFGVNYLIGSGNLFTLPIGKFRDEQGNLQLQYNTLNNYRSSFYQRLDISVLKLRDGYGTEQQWKIYVYNLLGARNPLNINAVFEDSSLTQLNIERNYLAFVPGIAYVIKF